MSDKQEYVMVPREASPEMIDAYLRANDAYWKRMDEMPPPPNKWRTGTPKDATAESYRAMLQAAPPAPAMHASASTGLKCADCYMDKEACPTCYEAWWKARHPNSHQMPDVAPPAPVAHSKSEYKRRVAMGDASILPPAPVAATGFDREYVRAYLEELLIDKIGNPHTDPEVSKFLEWLAAPVATEDHIPTMPAEDAAMLWLASVRDDFRKMADEANSTLQRRLVEMASAPVQPAPVAGPVAWHDIASAPKDGTAIMLRNEGGAWIGKWQSIAASGYTFDQPWRSLMLNHYHIPVSHRYLPPTHWMPLPPAPDASPSPAPVAAPVVTDAQIEALKLLIWWAENEGSCDPIKSKAAAAEARAILAAQSGAGTRGEQT